MTTPTPEKLALPADIKSQVNKLTSPQAKAEALLLLAAKYRLEVDAVREAINTFLNTEHKKNHASWIADRTGEKRMYLDILVERGTPTNDVVEAARMWNEYDYAIEMQRKAGNFREAGDMYVLLRQWEKALECYLKLPNAFFEIAECVANLPSDFVITEHFRRALLKAAQSNGDIALRSKYARLTGDKELLRKIYFEEIDQTGDYYNLEKIFARMLVDFPEERAFFGEKIIRRIKNTRDAKLLADKLGFPALSKEFAKKTYDEMKASSTRRKSMDTYSDCERGQISEHADEFADALKFYEQCKQYQDAIRMAGMLHNDTEIQRLAAKAITAYRAHPIHHGALAEALVEAKSPLAQKWLVKAMEYAERAGNLEKAANYARLAAHTRIEVYEAIFTAAKPSTAS